MRSTRVTLSVTVAALMLFGSVASAQAASVNFGCTTDGRTIAATAFYSANGSTQWFVDKIVYSYSNSGGGKTNTNFTVYNGAGAAAWTYATPDDRTNRSYTRQVDRVISRGSYARAYQKTWFDTFGTDPSCSRSAKF
jgi:hypothetical protein